MWMSKTLVVVLTVFSFNVMAEDTGHNADGTCKEPGKCGTESPTGKRAIAPDAIRKQDVELVAKLFPNLGKPFAQSVFTDGVRMKEVDYLPWSKALEKAKAKPADETDTSATMAVLFSTIGEKQRDEIVKQVEVARTAELSKADRRDVAQVDLLNRLFWAGKAIQGEISNDPEAQAFLKKFAGDKKDFKTGDFKTKQDENGNVLTKMNEALAGGTEAKKFLRDNLNRDAILPYADHQAKAGNKEFAAKLVDAVSWTQTNGGPKFVDMVGPGNEPQRLFIGNDNKGIQDTLATFSKEKGGFNVALAPTAFKQVAKEWFVENGKVVNGVPKGATSAKGAPADAAKGAVTGGDRNKSVASSNTKFDGAKAIADIKNSCTTCHSLTFSGTTPADFKMTVATPGKGQPLDLKEIAAAVKRPAMSGADATVKSAIAEWATLQ